MVVWPHKILRLIDEMINIGDGFGFSSSDLVPRRDLLCLR